MPRRRKPQPDMTDRELFESLFPKPVRERIRREVELDDEPEGTENAAENVEDEPISEEGT